MAYKQRVAVVALIARLVGDVEEILVCTAEEDNHTSPLGALKVHSLAFLLISELWMLGLSRS